MEEQLISFETAKLAKEKGFKWTAHNKLFYNDNSSLNIIEFSEEDIPAPTQALLQKWLREVHKIYICVSHRIFGVPEMHIVQYTTNTQMGIREDRWYDTYEEALEASFYEALNLIK